MTKIFLMPCNYPGQLSGLLYLEMIDKYIAKLLLNGHQELVPVSRWKSLMNDLKSREDFIDEVSCRRVGCFCVFCG